MDVMLDLETIGSQPGCVIAQVAAVCFEPEAEPGSVTAENYSGFVVNLNWQQQAKKYGLIIDPDSLHWWLQQPSEIIQAVFCDSIHENAGSLWLLLSKAHGGNLVGHGGSATTSRKTAQRWWSHGKDFDFPVLAAYMSAAQRHEPHIDSTIFKLPWKYNQLHEVRTVLDFAGLSATYPTVGQHSALADCLAQVADVQRAYAWRRQALHRDL